MKRLNIACGEDVKEGWDNLDKHDRYKANVIWNLNKLPLPFEDKSYDYILCSYFLEHLNDCLPLMNELIRLLKKDGQLEIIVPYGDETWDSIDHKRQFFITTFFDYLTDGGFEKRNTEELEIESYEFISSKKGLKLWMYNKLIKINRKIIDKTLLKLFSEYLSIKIIYKKIK